LFASINIFYLLIFQYWFSKFFVVLIIILIFSMNIFYFLFHQYYINKSFVVSSKLIELKYLLIHKSEFRD